MKRILLPSSHADVANNVMGTGKFVSCGAFSIIRGGLIVCAFVFVLF
jgi:hypothetical protein